MVIFVIDPVFIVFAVVPCIYSVLTLKYHNQLLYDRKMEILDGTRKRDYIKRVFYLSDYAKELRMTNISNVLFKRFFETVEDIKKAIKSHGLKISVVDYFAIILQYVVLFIGTIIYATYRTVVLKNMLLGDCVIVVNNIVSSAVAIKDAVNGYSNLHANALDIRNIRDFLEYEPVIKEEAGKLDAGSAIPSVALKNVDFSYTDSEKKVLCNINLEIREGEKIALVGHNGAGKSTLVKLLLRLYDPTRGTVELDGKDIREYGLESYRALFATVFQQFKIFSTDVIRNVWLKDDITKEEYLSAIEGMKNSGIYEKIQSLPGKERTVLTKEFAEDGAVFSGGENQKVAIARVFTRPCKIVIMDEPSSALDPIAEYKMFETMMKACEKKSVIYISHRLSSAVLADRIYLLENGEIIESGSHAELLALNGTYADMWAKQSEQYTKGVAADA